MIRLAITTLLILATAVANYGLSRTSAGISRRPLSEFPKEMNGWRLIGEQEIDEQSMATLLVDDYIMRTYKNSKGVAIGLYVGYFKNQREGKQVHSPRQCLPGSGWTTIVHEEYCLPLSDHFLRKISVNFSLMEKGVGKRAFLWWYQGRGRVYASEYLNKIYLVWDAATRNRTDGGLVRIDSIVTSSVEDTLVIEKAFVQALMPHLDEYIPK